MPDWRYCRSALIRQHSEDSQNVSDSARKRRGLTSVLELVGCRTEEGDDVRPVLGLDEETIELEINPDRAYALSLRGIAREVLVSVDGASNFRDPALRDPARPRAPGRTADPASQEKHTAPAPRTCAGTWHPASIRP